MTKFLNGLSVPLILMLATSLVHSKHPGVTTSLHLNMMLEGKEVFLARILREINTAQIPDIEFEKGYIKNSTFTVDEDRGDI